jgi:periplasmic divalent cation tolerance protein
MELRLVTTTVATRENAQRLAQAMVTRRLAACVQMSAIESVYEWNGALAQEAEVRLVLKTTQDRVDALQAALLEVHPYELPAIFVTPVLDAHEAYRGWVITQTREQREPA